MKVLLIVSANRSGSTLLDMLLGSIDGFFSCGELRYLWQRGVLQQRRCGCGLEISECSVWSNVLSTPRLSHLDPIEVVRWQHGVARVRHTRRLLKATSACQRDPELAALIAAMTATYEETRRVTGARVLVDSSKRPADAALAALLPGVQPYVVHLVRDPRAVAHSWRRRKPELDHENRPEMERRNAARVAGNWLWLNEVTSAIPRYKPALPFLRLRYEDVVAQPAASLRQIVTLVDESGAAPRVQGTVASLRPNHTVSGNPSRFSTGEIELRLDDEWQSNMDATSWLTATAISLPSLRGFGYSIGAGAPWARRTARDLGT